MDFRQLEYVVGVVDQGGFTRAAEALLVAQPSLSQSIQRLEAELGVRLFDRVGRGYRLTAAGQAFLGPARQLLRDREQLRAAIAAVGDLAAGTLELVSLPTLAAQPLAGMIGAFRSAHPGIVVHVAEPESTSELVEMVLDGRCEVGLTDLAAVSGNVVEVPLVDEEILAVFPPGTDVGSKSVTLRRLSHEPLVAGPLGTSTRDLVERAFVAADLVPTIAVESANREAIVPLVLAGAGAAFLHASSAATAAARVAVVVSLTPRLTRAVGFVHSDRPLSPAAVRFVQLARAERAA